MRGSQHEFNSFNKINPLGEIGRLALHHDDSFGNGEATEPVSRPSGSVAQAEAGQAPQRPAVEDTDLDVASMVGEGGPDDSGRF